MHVNSTQTFRISRVKIAFFCNTLPFVSMREIGIETRSCSLVSLTNKKPFTVASYLFDCVPIIRRCWTRCSKKINFVCIKNKSRKKYNWRQQLNAFFFVCKSSAENLIRNWLMKILKYVGMMLFDSVTISNGKVVSLRSTIVTENILPDTESFVRVLSDKIRHLIRVWQVFISFEIPSSKKIHRLAQRYSVDIFMVTWSLIIIN